MIRTRSDTLNENGIETDHPIEVIDRTNEEGTRFTPAVQGFVVFVGVLDNEMVPDCRDREGRILGYELDVIGSTNPERKN